MAKLPVKVLMIPPPGDIVAPSGFPAEPRPKGAPQGFMDAMEVRITVFCDEQKCSLEEELDEDDSRSWHWVAYLPDESGNDVPVSVIRIVPFPHGPHPNGHSDPDEEPYFKIGRVATVASARGKGLSRMLSEQAFSWMATHQAELPSDWNGLVLSHAQVTVEKMYEKLGFVTDVKLGRWDEVGIEHLGMWRRLSLEK